MLIREFHGNGCPGLGHTLDHGMFGIGNRVTGIVGASGIGIRRKPDVVLRNNRVDRIHLEIHGSLGGLVSGGVNHIRLDGMRTFGKFTRRLIRILSAGDGNGRLGDTIDNDRQTEPGSVQDRST